MTVSKTKAASIDYYRCNQVTRAGAKICPVRGTVERRNTDNIYRIHYTTWEHNHTNDNEKMLPHFKKIIIESFKNGQRPAQIHAQMTEKFGATFHYNIGQVRHVIRKHTEENIEPTVSIGDLIAWARSLRTVPEDIDTPFVISMTNLSTKFNIVFSTLRLLSHASRDVYSADTTYQTHWQGFPLNLVGCYDAMGQFHVLAAGLSSNETSNDYSFLFGAVRTAASKYHQMDVQPNYVMADAASEISNGFQSIFPYVKENEHSTLMCMFHVLKAVNTFKFRDPASKDAVKMELKVLQLCGNPAVFVHVLQLFLTKWESTEPAFCDYFQREWVQKHPNWYAAANLLAPNTNNGAEGKNSTIKSVHTMRQRLVFTMFKETFTKMLMYWSAMYNREKEAKIFYTEVNISRNDWSKAASYAMDTDTKRKIFVHDGVYYVLSSEKMESGELQIADGKSAADLFHSTAAATFEDYVQHQHQCVYQLKLNDDWKKSTCTCPYFMKHPMCKHILSVAMLRRRVLCPSEANPAALGQKPKRGRKSNAKGALHKPTA